MQFETPLLPATLLRRYKRFMADVRLENGQEVTAHCANPGSMLGLCDPEQRVWVEPVNNPQRKLKFSWRLLELCNGVFVGVDTSLPNKLLKHVLQMRQLPEFTEYDTVLSEQSCGEGSRIDFLLRGTNSRDTFVEVKSVTLSRRDGLAEFPDSVTARGAKHLHELATKAQKGYRAVLFYVVQRSDCRSVTVARDLDQEYALAIERAIASGVEVIAYKTSISTKAVEIDARLPFTIS